MFITKTSGVALFVGIVAAVHCPLSSDAQNSKRSIYHKDWIDFNKNGKKDIYEDPSQPSEKRIEDLVTQMTVEEKTAQTSTLYGYGRVLKDELPTPQWKNSIWKHGIANIDEELNSVPNNKKAATSYSFPFSKHVRAKNTVQKLGCERAAIRSFRYDKISSES